MNDTKPPKIERIAFSDLTINNLYSGRTEKEINENAKEKQKELAAAGGWSPSMPGQYFVADDGTKNLLAGFSRVKASLLNGESEGYFVKVEGDEIDYLLACETTNSVKTLSPLARGARYSDLKEGVIADDFEGALADPKEPKHWKRQPLTLQQIADKIGKTSEWVRKCIAIFEAPPEIRDLLESGKIAVTVVEGAKSLVDKHHNGSEAKQIAICKRAFAEARKDEKATATKQHFEAIKGEFIPQPKLVAAPVTQEPAKAASEPMAPKVEGEPAGVNLDAQEQHLAQSSEFAAAVEGLFDEQSERGSKLHAEIVKYLLRDDIDGVTMTVTEDEASILATGLEAILENSLKAF